MDHRVAVPDTCQNSLPFSYEHRERRTKQAAEQWRASQRRTIPIEVSNRDLGFGFRSITVLKWKVRKEELVVGFTRVTLTL